MNLMHILNLKSPTWAPDEPAGAPPESDPAPAGDPPAAPPEDAAPDAPNFDWIPEEFRSDDGPNFDGFKSHYEEMVAAQTSAKEDVPEDADGYEFAIPEEMDFGDMDLPKDFAVELKADDEAFAPLFKDLGGFLHKHGIPKSATPELMQTLAKYEASKASRAMAGLDAEMQALGAKAGARIETINRALDNRLPEEMATALKGTITTAAGVQALEKLLGPASLSAPAGEPQPEEDPIQAALAGRYGKAS